METVYTIEHQTQTSSKAVGIFSHLEDALGFLEAMMKDEMLFTPDSKLIISRAIIGGHNDQAH